MDAIVTSLLENDLYKFSMGQAIYHQFSDYHTTWTFKCRNHDVRFTQEMVEEIADQIRSYCSLSFTEDELDYLRGITWIKDSYVDYLRLWHPRYDEFTISTESPCGLFIETSGTWLNTSMYEVPVLAIVNEVYCRLKYGDYYYRLYTSGISRLLKKLEPYRRGKKSLGTFSEFGLRRRFSGEFQNAVISILSTMPEYRGDTRFAGTSNVYLAKEYGINPVGTMAHEWIMCVGQGNPKHNPAYSNWYALDAWVKEYGVLNGIALTDTITTDCFLKDFQLTYATLFNGVRHDSGDPIEWSRKMLAHYHDLGIDPKTKTLLFSDGLDFKRASDIYDVLHHDTNVAFGIGTYLSNDTGETPLNIVMKVTECNDSDVAKISDTPGKGMCKNPEYVDYLQRCIDWRIGKGCRKSDD